MYSRSCGIGYQMSIAHSHGDSSMPHQSLDAVYIFTITSQPACEGMPKTVKHDPSDSIIGHYAIVKSYGIHKSPKRMGQACAHTTIYNWRKDQTRWNFFFLLLPAFFENAKCSIVQRNFSPRLAVRFIAHREHSISHIHIRPFQSLKFSKPQSGIQRENNTVMQISVRQFFGSTYQGLRLIGSQKTLTRIFDGRDFDPSDRVLAGKNCRSRQFRETCQGKCIVNNTAVLFDGRRSRTSRNQAVNNSLNIFSHDGRKRLHADSGSNNFVKTLFVCEPASLGSFGFNHVNAFKEVLEGHIGDALFGCFLLGGSSLSGSFLPHFKEALRPNAGFSVLFDFIQHVMSFFCIPLFGRPSHAFLGSATVFFIAYGVVTIWLPVTLFTGRVLVVADSRVLCLDFKFFHAPTMPPLLGENKGAPGNIDMVYHTEIIIPRKLRELCNQIQGLVKVPSWEFESPLRHHKKASGLTEQSVGPFLLRGILLVLGQKNLVASIESK